MHLLSGSEVFEGGLSRLNSVGDVFSLLAQESSYETNAFILIGISFILTHCLVLGAFSKEELILTFQFFYPAQISPTHSSNYVLLKTGLLSLVNMADFL